MSGTGILSVWSRLSVASASHGKLQEMQILRLRSSSRESETLAVGLSNLCVNKPLKVLSPPVPCICVGECSFSVFLGSTPGKEQGML